MQPNNKVTPTNPNQNSTPVTHNTSAHSPRLSEEMLSNFFIKQTQDYELKKQENEAREKELDRAHEISLRTLEIQKELMMQAPNHSFKHKRLFIRFFLAILLIIAAVFIYCIYSGNKDVAVRIIETIVLILGSGSGGYAIAKGKKNKPKDEHPEAVD
jgi:hypothetical protein